MLKGAVKSSDAERINAKKEDQNKGDDGEEEKEKVWPICTQKGGHRYHPAPEIISTMPGSNAWKPPPPPPPLESFKVLVQARNNFFVHYPPEQPTPGHDGGSFYRCDEAWTLLSEGFC